MTETDAAQYWEDRYAGADRVWSGRVNEVLVDVASGLPPGSALDLGCGEGGDAIWLARRGWRVTGLDIAPTAIARAREAAAAAGIDAERARFVAQDLAGWAGDGDRYDLVCACFLHSWFEFPRTEVLRRAAGAVAPGGRMLIVAHAAPPPWMDLSDHPDHDHHFPSPADDLRALELPEQDWEVLVAEARPRQVTRPDGRSAELLDGVVLLRRR